MIISCVIGGLGNQMFQYAIAAVVAKNLGVDLYVEKSGFPRCGRSYGLDYFVLPALKGQLSRKAVLFYDLRTRVSGGSGLKLFHEDFLEYEKTLGDIEDNSLLVGEWQDFRRLRGYRDFILEQFEFKPVKNPKTVRYIELIQSLENPVSLHIRRGDRVQPNDFSPEYYKRSVGICDAEYYERSIRYIEDRVGEKLSLVVFSDEINHVRRHFDFGHRPVYFINEDSSLSDGDEMRLMSLCNHNIIANSGFSLWGAYLNQNPSKIVTVPDPFFNDCGSKNIVPDHDGTWIKVRKITVIA